MPYDENPPIHELPPEAAAAGKEGFTESSAVHPTRVRIRFGDDDESMLFRLPAEDAVAAAAKLATIFAQPPLTGPASRVEITAVVEVDELHPICSECRHQGSSVRFRANRVPRHVAGPGGLAGVLSPRT